MNPLYNRAVFLKGVAELSQLPPDEGYEVAFVGRSNVGKSSALNAITRRRSLARTSKTPGRTQQINFFTLDESRRLVDLPGYGYAKVPEAVKRHWQAVLGRYLSGRKSLCGIIILMDIRRPLTDFDIQMLDFCHQSGVPACVLLTKADKLKRGPASAVMHQVKSILQEDYSELTPRTGGGKQSFSVHLFSALKKQGVDAVHRQLDAWLQVGE